MAATTTLLSLVTPTQGTLSGTWGDTVNYGISDYLDIAIAGTLSFAGDGAITLANTVGSASGNAITTTTAQYMVIRITGTQSVVKVITGPSYSKLYMVDHAGATSAVTFKAAGQTGVSVAVGEKCFVYYNGTDYVKVASSVVSASSLTGVVGLANGGSGQTTAQAAMNAFAGAVTSGSYLRGNGTNVVMNTIQAADVPTLNQNTSGSAATFTSTSQNSQFNSIGVGTAGSGTAGEIRATNNVTAYYSSDIKFKENVRVIPDALATVNAIGGKLFDWTDEYIEDHGGADGYFVQKADFGVIAQDVQKVFPIAVRTREDGSLAVDYEKLGALAFAALIELTKRVEALEAK
jgi:hypothetical protein